MTSGRTSEYCTVLCGSARDSRECRETILVDLTSVLLIGRTVLVLGVYIDVRRPAISFFFYQFCNFLARLHTNVGFFSKTVILFAHEQKDYFGVNFTGNH